MQFVYSKKAQKQFEKLDTITQKRIKNLTQELESLENPRSKGEALVGNLGGLWRYRVGDYRIICEINDNELLIYAIHIAHRKEVYQ
ncbi:type II toxin-antitoxin system RelE/ParE family toxin [uncultured Helicobacter sp.]|uniref:type II toxin-antitoxin system RelE family toxin n=1 Tax=uncultured Helicobacter sp. TaxID=175537 RepID=UPI0026328B59|nr:type II toxin-antitoxin system RelE/ParE family toxin [uncultured Helicobacter sp.]